MGAEPGGGPVIGVTEVASVSMGRCGADLRLGRLQLDSRGAVADGQVRDHLCDPATVRRAGGERGDDELAQRLERSGSDGPSHSTGSGNQRVWSSVKRKPGTDANRRARVAWVSA